MKFDAIKFSKFLSLVLRHKPETIGLKLDANGWANVAELIKRCQDQGWDIDFEKLSYVVSTNNKNRFKFGESCSKIRANQGHSIKVDLAYKPSQPPEFLYHGTGLQTIRVIQVEGLKKMGRHHVHLSTDIETALKVGQRHGTPYVLTVLSGEMAKEGFTFYLSDNGVWLTDHVPSKYLQLDTGPKNA